MSHTQNFIVYLTEIANGEKQFGHKYRHADLKKDFEFNSLENAFEKYNWEIKEKFRSWIPDPQDFSCYADNAVVLDRLSIQIKEAYREESNTKLFDASKDILHWGGVDRRARNNKGNVPWLEDNRDNIFQLYKETKEAFENNKFNEIARSNAGFTKIYALLFDNFAIYDSRVAATFGLLAVGYCREKMLNLLPDELNFVRMNGRGHLRDASTGGISFRAMNYQSPGPHAQSNDKANYILTQVVRRVSRNSPFHGDVRKLEAALFMIGYDLTGHEWLSPSK